MLPENSQARFDHVNNHLLVLGYCFILFQLSALEAPEVFVSQRLLMEGLRGQFVFCVWLVVPLSFAYLI